MSFALANQAVQKFIIKNRYAYPYFENIRAILDARRYNTRMIELDTEEMAFGNGMKRRIKLSYYPVQPDIIASSADQNICTTGNQQQPIQDWFNLNKFIATKPQSLSPNDLRLVDGRWDISDHAMAQIAASMGAMRKELSSQIDTDLVLHAGKHLDGNATMRVTMSNTTNGLITPLGLWQIEKEFADGGYTNPFILGSTEVYNFIKAKGIATDNTTLGQDFRRVNIDHLYYDVTLNSVMGDVTGGEYIYAFDPEALKFVSFSENAGMFATDWKSPSDFDMMFKRGSANRIWGSFVDPDYGILWDFNAHFDECVGKNGMFTWNMQLLWDIFYPPIQSGNIQGVNGIFLYRTCPVVIPVCPTGDTPSPAAVSRVFNWVPAATYPFILNDVTIGGVSARDLSLTISNLAGYATALNNVFGTTMYTTSGGAIRYTGYSALSGSANNATVTITFA